MQPFHIRDSDEDLLSIIPYLRREREGSNKTEQMFRFVVNDAVDKIEAADLSREELKQVRDYINKVLDN